MQKFYYRLENSETTFPLSYNALLESKVLHNLKKNFDTEGSQQKDKYQNAYFIFYT
jgi:hypothetical protein